jgi:hypothetical protein
MTGSRADLPTIPIAPPARAVCSAPTAGRTAGTVSREGGIRPPMARSRYGFGRPGSDGTGAGRDGTEPDRFPQLPAGRGEDHTIVHEPGVGQSGRLHPLVQEIQRLRPHQGRERAAQRDPPLDVLIQTTVVYGPPHAVGRAVGTRRPESPERPISPTDFAACGRSRWRLEDGSSISASGGRDAPRRVGESLAPKNSPGTSPKGLVPSGRT